MQDITKAKCSSSSIANGTEGRLIDSRDGKIYWVAKLKDGLCWMTQNLDYSGGAVDGYSGGDAATLTAGTSFTSGTQSQKLYYDPGDYVYTGGSSTNSCGNQSTSTGLSGCANSGWISVDELQSSWVSTDEDYFVSSTNYIGTDGQSICSKEAGSMFGNKEYAQCRIYYYAAEHYSAGNYYNWMTATNGSTASSGSVDTSICPTGWSLPVGYNSDTDGSFYKLVNGLSNTQITVAPYYFVYGGSVYDSTLNSAGSSGLYWSATVASSSGAYFSSFSSSNISLSGAYNRYYGMSVRCVAR